MPTEKFFVSVEVGGLKTRLAASGSFAAASDAVFYGADRGQANA
jgi:hypothetical protein